jgi:hypothetical protein
MSCEVGSADIPYNLTHSLLLSGGAIGMLSSSAPTPGDLTDYSHGARAVDPATFGGTNAGIGFFTGLLDGRTGAEAFAEARVTLGTGGDSETYAAKMMLNYFGDPTLRLDASEADVVLE